MRPGCRAGRGRRSCRRPAARRRPRRARAGARAPTGGRARARARRARRARRRVQAIDVGVVAQHAPRARRLRAGRAVVLDGAALDRQPVQLEARAELGRVRGDRGRAHLAATLRRRVQQVAEQQRLLGVGEPQRRGAPQRLDLAVAGGSRNCVTAATLAACAAARRTHPGRGAGVAEVARARCVRSAASSPRACAPARRRRRDGRRPPTAIWTGVRKRWRWVADR